MHRHRELCVLLIVYDRTKPTVHGRTAVVLNFYNKKIRIDTVYSGKTNLPFFSSHRTDFRPGFPHSRAQDVSTHVRKNIPTLPTTVTRPLQADMYLREVWPESLS